MSSSFSETNYSNDFLLVTIIDQPKIYVLVPKQLYHKLQRSKTEKNIKYLESQVEIRLLLHGTGPIRDLIGSVGPSVHTRAVQNCYR